jgi:hypothetical protein
MKLFESKRTVMKTQSIYPSPTRFTSCMKREQLPSPQGMRYQWAVQADQVHFSGKVQERDKAKSIEERLDPSCEEYEYLSQESIEYRRHMASLDIQSIQDDTLKAPLIRKALRDGNPRIRYQAAFTIGTLKSDTFKEPLLKEALNDQDKEVRYLAANGPIASLRSDPVKISFIQNVLDDAYIPVRAAAAWAICALKEDESKEPLIQKALGTPRYRVQLGVNGALKSVQSEKVRLSLRQHLKGLLLQSEDPDTLQKWEKALGIPLLEERRQAFDKIDQFLEDRYFGD